MGLFGGGRDSSWIWIIIIFVLIISCCDIDLFGNNCCDPCCEPHHDDKCC